MDESSLKILLDNNINMIFNAEAYEKYLSQGMSIIGYDFMNRFLIFFQNRRASDIKDEIGWVNFGRKVTESTNPIWILVPVYSTKYFSVDTGECFEETIAKEGLSIDEINKAVSLGIIERKRDIIRYKSEAVYDINDTVLINEDVNKVGDNTGDKEILKISSLYNICKKLSSYSIKAIENGKTFYKKEENTLYISKENSISNATAILKILVTNLVEISLKEVKDNANSKDECAYEDMHVFYEKHEEFIVDSIMYTVCKYLGIKYHCTFDCINQVYIDGSDTEILTNAMNIIENTKNNIIINLSNKKSSNSVSGILARKKAEQLLDILEANNARLLINRGF